MAHVCIQFLHFKVKMLLFFLYILHFEDSYKVYIAVI